MNAALNALSRLAFLAALLTAGQAHASLFQVTVDTSALAGTSATLAFDFIDGNAVADSSVTISGFGSDGTLGGSQSFGGVTGTLSGTGSVILDDTSFFSEFLQDITLGNTFMFTVETFGNFGGGTPDAFSFFILDEFAFSSLVSTTGPADALLLYNIGVADPPQPEVYQAFTIPSGQGGEPEEVPITATTVPEPGGLVLAMVALLALGVVSSARRPSQRSDLTARS